MHRLRNGKGFGGVFAAAVVFYFLADLPRSVAILFMFVASSEHTAQLTSKRLL